MNYLILKHLILNQGSVFGDKYEPPRNFAESAQWASEQLGEILRERIINLHSEKDRGIENS